MSGRPTVSTGDPEGEQRLTRLDLVVARYAEKRARVVAAFLWVLLGAALLALLGRTALHDDPPALGAPVAFFGVILGLLATGIVLNRRGHGAGAVWCVTLAFLAGLYGSQLQPGGDGLSPYYLFLPLALSGLLLRRRALLLTAGASLVGVWLPPLAALAGARSPLGTDAIASAPVEFSVVYVALAFLLERFGIALRWALYQAAEHEGELLDQALDAKAELEEQRELNEAIRESFPGVYYVVDDQGNYVQWNRNVLEMLGISEDELRRTNALDLVAPDDRDAVRRAIGEALERGSTSLHARAVSKDGHALPFYLAASRVSLSRRRLVAGVGIDRREIDSARARIDSLNDVLRERLGTLGALHAIDAAIANTRDLRPTLGLILEHALERLHLDAGNVLVYSAPKERLEYGASRGFRDSEWRPVSVPIGHGLVGRCAERRTVIALLGADDIARHLWRHDQYRREGFETYVAVPLVANGELMGVVEYFARARINPDGAWHDFLRAVAAQAAIAIDNANLIEGLERSNEALVLSYDRTIEGWAKALDLKDEETVGHSRRVTELSVALARRLGMKEEEVTHVRRGALLHDIGKMGVPDAILLKPGRLDPDEWEAMKRHTTHAYEMLKPIPFLWQALDIPYLHHERWDGTGYPLGLKRDEIPRSARIFAVVDVYDALTNDRPYRPAWSRERALAYIAEQAGKQFDPAIAAEFLRMMGADRAGRAVRAPDPAALALPLAVIREPRPPVA